MSEDTTTNAPSSIEELKTGMLIKGIVKRIELYGAFVDIGIGQDALLHISQLSNKKVSSVEDVVNIDDEIEVYVLKVDQKAGRVALTREKPAELPWDNIQQGETYDGKVVRLEKFGAFVDIGAERPGMVHVSEMAEGYVKDPSDVVKEGQDVSVRVLKVNRKKRQIDLSMREPTPEVADVMADEDEDMPTAMELAFRKAQAQADDDTPKAQQRKKQSDKSRQQQADIIARTLRDQGQE
jgi:small subunit ribosomal protein S1